MESVYLKYCLTILFVFIGLTNLLVSHFRSVVSHVWDENLSFLFWVQCDKITDNKFANMVTIITVRME